MRRVLAVFVVGVVGCGGNAVHHLGPDAVLDSTPAALTNQTHAVFTFHADGDADAFTCAVDAVSQSCTSPFAVDLTMGMHTFSVMASDKGDVGDPATFSWMIQTTPPDTTITSGPPPLDSTPTEMFAFTGTTGTVGFQCILDGGSASPCASPLTLTPADGTHAFSVAAVDGAGNIDPSPATWSWKLDTTIPDTTITSGPGSGTTSGPDVSFAFVGTQGAVGFQCSVDSVAFATCTSPLALTLTDGAHTFAVQAVDAQNVTDPTPAMVGWTVDATPPTVSITSAPNNPSDVAVPAFSFTSTDPTATFQCAIDPPSASPAGDAARPGRAGAFDLGSATGSACTSPFTGTALADGAHTFVVTATDPFGNADNASFTWTIDTVAPVVTITGAPAAFIATNSATVAFTVAGNPATVDCSLDGGSPAPCTSPQAFTKLPDGLHSFEVLATDTAGNVGTASTSFTVDTTPPVVAITSAPPSPTNNATPSVGFTVSGATTINCRVDGGAFVACASPFITAHLADGSHTVTVQGVDEVGNIGTAATTFTVDTTAPTVTITSHPANPTNLTTATFGFTVSDGTTQCRVDGGAFASCSTGVSFSGFAQGSHTFTVQSTDTAGNVGSAAFTWTIDTTPPTVTITSGPANPSNSKSATFTFTVPDGTVQCQLDTGAFAACSSPVTFSGLADGSHTFTVKSTDTAGNVGSASASWVVDTTPPTVAITSHPSNPSNSSSASFGFTVSDGTIQCKIDTGAFASCASPDSFAGLADGSHTFTVQSTDTAGNIGSAAFTWTIDTTPPTVTITSGPKNPSNSKSATFTFTVSDGTIACSLDGAAFTSCSSPTTVSGLADGSHTFTVKSTDTAGNVGSASQTWVVDTTAPTVTITSGPKNPSNSSSATFTFTVSDGTIQCKVDGGAFASCSSPATFTGLADGSHTFTVQSTDTAGNVGSASQTWTIDTTPPTVTITSHPNNPSNSSSATFGFTVSDGTIQCKVDGGAFASCSSPATLSGLADGSHTFTVQSTDTAGNVGSASFTWIIDTTAPTVSITSHPNNPTNQTSATFAFTVSDGTIQCKLDSGAFASCSSPVTFSGLASTSHTFTVQSTDTAGNVGSASFTWTIDTTPPTVTITSHPNNPTNQTSATFAFTVSDGTIQCQLDGGAFASCSSPVTFSGLASTSHTFTVQSTDTAGNVGSASFTWTIDTTAPTVTITSHPNNPSNSTSATFGFTVSDGTIQCRIDGGAFASCSSPATFSGLAEASHTFTVQSTDTAGNVGSASFTWIIDTTPPTVSITSHPNNPTNQTSATFAFTVSDGTIQCKLDSGTFASCSSPVTFSGLASTSHTFTVQSTDTAGNVGSASFTWTIDTTPPTVTITSGPKNPSNSATATFTFTVSDGTIQCKVDSGAFAACSSPATFAGLAVCSHTFTVQSTDTAGNVGSASQTWTIDTTPPVVTINSGPKNPTNSTSATFTFSANETATFTCKIDSGTAAACTSPATFTVTGDGSHTFTVTATDTAGNVGTPATFTWTLDTTPPTVTITSGPKNPTNQTTDTFTFTVSDGTVTCSVDGGTQFACSSPATVSGLADGSHTFNVQSTDTAGNVGSASFTWVQNTTPPALSLDDTPPANWPVDYYDMKFSSTTTGVTFQCSLNGAAFAACSSPDTVTTTYGSASTFAVEATDTAGNVTTKTATWTSTAGLVLHYQWESNTNNTSLLVQRPTYSPNGTLTAPAVGGGWAGAALSPPVDTYKGTSRVLQSQPAGTYAASIWVLAGATTAQSGTLWSIESATAGMSLEIAGTTVTLTVLVNGTRTTKTATLVAGEWANVAVTTTGVGKGVNLILNGRSQGNLATGNAIGFDAGQSDLTVGPLTGVTIDDLRFYNAQLTTAQLCSESLHGTTNVDGVCTGNFPAIDLRFEGGSADDAGTGQLDDVLNPTFTSVTTPFGEGIAIENGVTGGPGSLQIIGFAKVVATGGTHTLGMWFASFSGMPADTLFDFTTTCSVTTPAPTPCGISAIYNAAGSITVLAGTNTPFQSSVTIPVTTAGFHSLTVTDQLVTGAASPTTKQLTIFLDGVATVLPVGSGDVYQVISDTIIGPDRSETEFDEIRFFPTDVSTDPETLCENGQGGEFSHVNGTCTLP